MVSRKQRPRVVLDTNIIACFYLSRNPRTANVTVFRLWRDRRSLELVVSPEVVAEYKEILERLAVDQRLVQRFVERLQSRVTVTWINLGPRIVASRDPDDDILLSTAQAGDVEYLITNDRDLLDLGGDETKRLRFEIVTPYSFLTRLSKS